MSKRQAPKRGDIYWIDPNPVAGKEMKNRHRFVVITPQEINALGLVMTVPITTGGEYARKTGLSVFIGGHDTTGVAVCNQVRTFDIEERIKQGSARYIETIADDIVQEIVNRVISVIDPD